MYLFEWFFVPNLFLELYIFIFSTVFFFWEKTKAINIVLKTFLHFTKHFSQNIEFL